MRELRDLTRTSLRQDHTAVANGMQKILEEAHVKIASVATDWLGVCGRKILQQMLDGEPDSKKLADVCRGRLREKIPERELALEGRRTSHHRWMLRLQREQLEFLERQIPPWQRLAKAQPLSGRLGSVPYQEHLLVGTVAPP